MTEIIDFTVDKKAYNRILLMWGVNPPTAADKFIIQRSINDADEFEAIASGYNSAYIDVSSEVLQNKNISYRILMGEISSDTVKVDIDADPYVYDAAETYLWRLNEGREGVAAKAFCKADLDVHCSECWSESLNKRIQSKCTSCDGSGMISAYKGPVDFNINLSQIIDSTGMVGMLEEDTTMVNAWTGDLPIFTKGDIVVIGPVRYIINARPIHHRMTSHSNGKPFIIKQNLQLLLLDHNHIAYSLEVK
jgi:hypothetical protein